MREREDLIDMPEVKDLMTKREEVATARETSTVVEVAKAMLDRNVGTVLITGDGDRLSGLVTDRKITTDVVGKGKDPVTTEVKEIMTERLERAKANNPVCAEVQHMRDEGVRRMPVVDDRDRIVGVLSLADVAKEHARECDACADNILQIESRYI